MGLRSGKKSSKATLKEGGNAEAETTAAGQCGNSEVACFLLEQKISSMNTAGTVCMTWWVSSVVFCGSILAAIWLKKSEIATSRFLLFGLSFVLTIFFIGVVLFGIAAIQYLKRLTVDLSKLAYGNVFLTEVTYFIWAMKIGTWSFGLILSAWFILGIILWTGIQ